MCGSDTGSDDNNNPAPTVVPVRKPTLAERGIGSHDAARSYGIRRHSAPVDQGVGSHDAAVAYGIRRHGERHQVTDGNGNVVTDSRGKPVKAEPYSRERHEREIHKDEPVLNEDNLTPEEAEAQRRGQGRTPFSDKRKSRLHINRKNPSVAVGTKRHRTGVAISN